ncbi:hypothetical protein [Chengkuizengella marina]|uniref:Uncharacterized protein n=1 Tax=Chengkuizengella marina TaxID=2507566 RepID=A0A6N9Q8U4_9BACL|nr:hypothetical protein [Chengkuizengella marina]NBI31140.1 hypothetical protein [Chengkuizengella marina]
MNIEFYQNLPDRMSKSDLKIHFNKLLHLYNTTKDYTKFEFSEVLYQLSERQWYTYEVLDGKLQMEIDKLTKELWDQNSYEVVDNVTSIVAHLGLKESYQIIKQSLSSNLDNNIKGLIEETIKELDGNNEDPYSGMN